jgi:3-oxoacyl-ACP reductase-like protein
MSILGSIISKIFHKSDAAAAAPAAPTPAPAEASAPAPAPAAAEPIDVTAILDGLEKDKHQKLDWRHSIVDLMKLLDLDSSHAARIELAHELQYSGNTEDSAAMNIWLHKQVMQKLAENGGKVPDELKH